MPKTYNLTDLDESPDRELDCSLCAGVIKPSAPMTYRIDDWPGFMFFHPACALAQDALDAAEQADAAPTERTTT